MSTSFKNNASKSNSSMNKDYEKRIKALKSQVSKVNKSVASTQKQQKKLGKG